ncbi:hypothetical protein MesoLj131a_36700 [Mesorhizobium sp. 131-2-1]|nr:hypothetical protein MesoLj131a_36700 [Mesorhizobium sp. 131-2-1]
MQMKASRAKTIAQCKARKEVNACRMAFLLREARDGMVNQSLLAENSGPYGPQPQWKPFVKVNRYPQPATRVLRAPFN